MTVLAAISDLTIILVRVLAILAAAVGITVALWSAVEVGQGYAEIVAERGGIASCRPIVLRAVASVASLVAMSAVGTVIAASLIVGWVL
jgi:hypothetical protein